MGVWVDESFENGANGSQVSTATTMSNFVFGSIVGRSWFTHSTDAAVAGAKSARWFPTAPGWFAGTQNAAAQFLDTEPFVSRVTAKFSAMWPEFNPPFEYRFDKWYGHSSTVFTALWVDPGPFFPFAGPHVYQIGLGHPLKVSGAYSAGTVFVSWKRATPDDLAEPFIPDPGVWYRFEFDVSVSPSAVDTFFVTARVYRAGTLVSARTITRTEPDSPGFSEVREVNVGNLGGIGGFGPGAQTNTYHPVYLDGLFGTNTPVGSLPGAGLGFLISS